MMKMNFMAFFLLFITGVVCILSVMSNGFSMTSSMYLNWELMSSSVVGFNFLIFVDKISILFVSSVILISSAVMLFSNYYMQGEKFYLRFHLLVFLFVASMILMILSPNLFSILLGWDGLGVTSFLLVIYYQNSKSINAGLLTMFTNRIGDVLIILSLCLLAFTSNLSMFIDLNFMEKTFVVSLLIIFAAFTKSAQMPFSAWLPSAMAAPTPVSSLVHSSTLVTAGVYLLIRYSQFLDSEKLSLVLLMIGASTMLLAGMTAMYDNDMKKVVAFSTLSQLGLMMYSLGLGMSLVTFYHLLIHAYFKAMLFLGVGVMIHMASDYQDMNKVSYKAFNYDSLFYLMVASNFSLVGIPFMSGFYSKDCILELLTSSSFSVFIVLAGFLGVIFTVGYSVRLMVSLYFMKESESVLSLSEVKASSAMKGVLLLWPFVLSSGSFVGWAMQDYPCMSYLFMETKIFTLILIFSLILVWAKLQAISLFFKPFSWSLGTLWTLSYLSSPMISNLSLLLGKSSFLIWDSFWVGWMTFSGSSKTSKSISGISLSRISGDLSFQLMSLSLGVVILWLL